MDTSAFSNNALKDGILMYYDVPQALWLRAFVSITHENMQITSANRTAFRMLRPSLEWEHVKHVYSPAQGAAPPPLYTSSDQIPMMGLETHSDGLILLRSTDIRTLMLWVCAVEEVAEHACPVRPLDEMKYLNPSLFSPQLYAQLFGISNNGQQQDEGCLATPSASAIARIPALPLTVDAIRNPDEAYGQFGHVALPNAHSAGSIETPRSSSLTIHGISSISSTSAPISARSNVSTGAAAVGGAGGQGSLAFLGSIAAEKIRAAELVRINAMRRSSTDTSAANSARASAERSPGRSASKAGNASSRAPFASIRVNNKYSSGSARAPLSARPSTTSTAAAASCLKKPDTTSSSSCPNSARAGKKNLCVTVGAAAAAEKAVTKSPTTSKSFNMRLLGNTEASPPMPSSEQQHHQQFPMCPVCHHTILGTEGEEEGQQEQQEPGKELTSDQIIAELRRQVAALTRRNFELDVDNANACARVLELEGHVTAAHENTAKVKHHYKNVEKQLKCQEEVFELRTKAQQEDIVAAMKEEVAQQWNKMKEAWSVKEDGYLDTITELRGAAMHVY